MTGETATRVAVKVLSGMAEGRGFNMGEEVGMEWENEEVDGIGESLTLPYHRTILTLQFGSTDANSTAESTPNERNRLLLSSAESRIPHHRQSDNRNFSEESWYRSAHRRCVPA